MPMSREFAIGELLTAEDVNAHLVNYVPTPGDPWQETIEIPLPEGFTGQLFVTRTGVEVEIVTDNNITAPGAGGWVDGQTDVLPPGSIPERFCPGRNRHGALYLSSHYTGTAIVRANGSLSVFQRSGATRGPAAQFTIKYQCGTEH